MSLRALSADRFPSQIKLGDRQTVTRRLHFPTDYIRLGLKNSRKQAQKDTYTMIPALPIRGPHLKGTNCYTEKRLNYSEQRVKKEMYKEQIYRGRDETPGGRK